MNQSKTNKGGERVQPSTKSSKDLTSTDGYENRRNPTSSCPEEGRDKVGSGGGDSNPGSLVRRQNFLGSQFFFVFMTLIRSDEN